ncbi:capsule biosynthesis protein CapA [Staphylococcus haemolyticus]|uniref:Wzz/FepE/Etk N-terminal domain-containing protein n=1 Tax=Staphylococcus TaxID=1279 RepID=UPI0004A9AA50|nr:MULTISPECIES: Wzz/FepE/Etk N-terminal domain-containing protein [Staphylococcus]KDP49110.1 capsular polysaccharide type 8 biosynthesis protein cap8A [Staphylococcus aureus subsp. aureus CO-98]MBF9287815.1 capsule biosynthesis protein CapA [Staphylococcus haemolyticus]MBK3945697.1 capsule biosynthesis protein CapA [Staphylococcus haemolyticus]MBK3954948.1 capsule biosynthesis protein CapA [Staphylococcus haemolyticus]MBV5129879.1 capsule biosynthesis protein CapA [Staphylococcus haemolyticus
MENSLDLSKFLGAIKKNWKLLVLLPIIFMLISLLVTVFLMKPKYEANTQVLVNQKEKNNEYMAQEVQSNLQLVNTYAEILKSPRIIDDVAKKDSKYSSSQIKSMLDITSQSDSQILTINVKNGSKADAENVANEIAQVFKKDMPKIMSIDNVSVLSKADGTATKVSPNLIQNLAIGLILGLILGMVIIVIKELFDKRIKTEEDVERELDIPVLGSIAKLK